MMNHVLKRISQQCLKTSIKNNKKNKIIITSNKRTFINNNSTFLKYNNKHSNQLIIVKKYSTTSPVKEGEDVTTEKPEENEEIKEKDEIDIHEIYLAETDAHTYKLVEWYKTVGDEVQEEESLCEIETDLFTFDIPAPHNGILVKQVKATGSNLTQEELIALMVDSEEDFEKYKEKSNPVDIDLSVEKWLINLCPDSKLDQYAETFTNEGFDSIKAITMIEKDDLKDMGVKKGHMKLILGGIEMLNKEEDNNDHNGHEDDD